MGEQGRPRAVMNGCNFARVKHGAREWRTCSLPSPTRRNHIGMNRSYHELYVTGATQQGRCLGLPKQTVSLRWHCSIACAMCVCVCVCVCMSHSGRPRAGGFAPSPRGQRGQQTSRPSSTHDQEPALPTANRVARKTLRATARRGGAGEVLASRWPPALRRISLPTNDRNKRAKPHRP